MLQDCDQRLHVFWVEVTLSAEEVAARAIESRVKHQIVADRNLKSALQSSLGPRSKGGVAHRVRCGPPNLGGSAAATSSGVSLGIPIDFDNMRTGIPLRDRRDHRLRSPVSRGCITMNRNARVPQATINVMPLSSRDVALSTRRMTANRVYRRGSTGIILASLIAEVRALRLAFD